MDINGEVDVSYMIGRRKSTNRRIPFVHIEYVCVPFRIIIRQHEDDAKVTLIVVANKSCVLDVSRTCALMNNFKGHRVYPNYTVTTNTIY